MSVVLASSNVPALTVVVPVKVLAVEPDKVTVPAPVLLRADPAPLTTPEKVAKPPSAAVKVAVLFTATLPLKVAEPASLMPRVPVPEGVPMLLMTKLSMATESRLPEPVEELKATTRKTKFAWLSSEEPKSPVSKVSAVVPQTPGSLQVPSVVNEVGAAPTPYWIV